MSAERSPVSLMLIISPRIDLPQRAMGLRSSETHRELKISLRWKCIYYTYPTKHHRPALNVLRTVGQNRLTRRPFYTEVLTISWSLLTPVQKVTNIVWWEQTGYNRIAPWPSWLRGSPRLPGITRDHSTIIASLGKRSKFKIWGMLKAYRVRTRVNVKRL